MRQFAEHHAMKNASLNPWHLRLALRRQLRRLQAMWRNWHWHSNVWRKSMMAFVSWTDISDLWQNLIGWHDRPPNTTQWMTSNSRHWVLILFSLFRNSHPHRLFRTTTQRPEPKPGEQKKWSASHVMGRGRESKSKIDDKERKVRTTIPAQTRGKNVCEQKAHSSNS